MSRDLTCGFAVLYTDSVMNKKEQFLQRLVEKQAALSLTDADVARALGYSDRRVWNHIKCGVRPLTANTINRAITAFRDLEYWGRDALEEDALEKGAIPLEQVAG